MMRDDDEPTSLGQRRREADARVRQLNKADFEDGKVVAFRPRKPEATPRTPWRPGALSYWAGIVVLLLAWYGVDRFVLT